jgi:hypothetical protein
LTQIPNVWEKVAERNLLNQDVPAIFSKARLYIIQASTSNLLNSTAIPRLAPVTMFSCTSA